MSKLGKTSGEVVECQPGKEPQKLREFPQYPVEQVMEVARMLYANAPFKPELWREKWRWHSLARQAFDFLDNLSAACAEIARQRSATDAGYRRAEKRIADAEKWKDPMRLETGATRATREQHIPRALAKLEAILPQYLGSGIKPLTGGVSKPATPQTIRAQIAHWRKRGITRDEVMELQRLNDERERTAREKREARRAREQARKRRKQWEEKRISDKLSKTLLKTALSGEID